MSSLALGEIEVALMSKSEPDGGTFLGFDHEGGDEEEQSMNAMIIVKEDCRVVVRGEGGPVHNLQAPSG